MCAISCGRRPAAAGLTLATEATSNPVAAVAAAGGADLVRVALTLSCHQTCQSPPCLRRLRVLLFPQPEVKNMHLTPARKQGRSCCLVGLEVQQLRPRWEWPPQGYTCV